MYMTEPQTMVDSVYGSYQDQRRWRSGRV